MLIYISFMLFIGLKMKSVSLKNHLVLWYGKKIKKNLRNFGFFLKKICTWIYSQRFEMRFTRVLDRSVTRPRVIYDV